MLKELFQTFLPGKNMVVNITKSALHCTQKMSENDHRTFESQQVSYLEWTSKNIWNSTCKYDVPHV